MVEEISSALVADTGPKSVQLAPSVEYCQVPLPDSAVIANPLSAPASTSFQPAAVRMEFAVVLDEVVFSSVLVSMIDWDCSDRTDMNDPADVALLYSVAIQPADRTTDSTRTSSTMPSTVSVFPIRPPM